MVGEYETKTKRLSYFLSADDPTTLKIPHYQRGYSWKSDQVSDFFSDLYEHMDESDLYYFGTITTISRPTKNDVEVYELIDGQQRFTTAVILMACIRDKFHELGSPTHEKETEDQIFNKDAKGYDVYYKLILDKDDDLFFRNNILKIPEPGSDKFTDMPVYEPQINLKNAYETIQKSIDDELGRDWKGKEIEFLNTLKTTLRKKFVISNLEVSKSSKAYALFNKMNDRGLKLVPSELAKDLILSLIDDEINNEAAKDATEQWRELENKLSRKKITINNYIHHYLVTFHPRTEVDDQGHERLKDMQKSKDFDTLEEILKPKKTSNSESKITGIEFLNDLLVRSNNYEVLISYRLLGPSKTPKKILHHPKISSKAEDNIRWINELGIIIVYPVLMAGLEKYDKNDFEKLTDILLKWFFRVKTVANRNASALEKELANITYRMMKEDPKSNESLNIDNVRNKLIDLDITPKVFDSYLRDLSLGSKQSKYFLTKIIEFQQSKDQTDLPYPSTLEHIMPKEIKKITTLENGQKFTWLEYIKDVNNMSEEDAISFHQNYKNRLGNLTLISKPKNASIGVAPFDKKCARYDESQIQLNRDITKYDQWDKKAIVGRQNDLTEIAEKVWKV